MLNFIIARIAADRIESMTHKTFIWSVPSADGRIGMTWTRQTRPDLNVRLVRRKLANRDEPYRSLLCYGRHLGYLRRGKLKTYWVARARSRDGKYRQYRLGRTDDQCKADGVTYPSYVQATRKAKDWYRASDMAFGLGDVLPIGIKEELNYVPVGSKFTVGHALSEYLEWKRIAATKSYFQTLVGLINFHLLPRLGTLPADEFNGERLRVFAQDVLETPPKRGNQALQLRRPVVDENALRRRKSTVNTLIGILRVALQMAWENGKIDNDRSWRGCGGSRMSCAHAFYT